MKIPRSVILCGKPCKIIQESDHNGGEFSCAEMTIKIGTADPDQIEENFVHEVSEAILAIRDYRYITEKLEPDSGDYRFFMDHKEFQLFARDFAIAMRGISFAGAKKIK